MSSSPGNPRLSVKILAILVGICLAILLAELLVRILAPHPRYPYYYIPDGAVGMRYKPNHRGRATNIFGEFDTAIEINSEGFRDRDHSIEKPPHTYRIAVLGDSFTEAEQVEEKECFTRKIEIYLNDYLQQKGVSDFKVEVMNFGVGGFELYQYLLCYETYVRKYHPDLVLVASFVHNDILGNVFYLESNKFGRPYYKLVGDHLEKVPANMELLEANYAKIHKRLQVRWYHHLQVYNAQKQIFWALRQYLRLSSRKQQQKQPSNKNIWSQAGNGLFRYYAYDGSDPVVREADAVSKLLAQQLEAELNADRVAFRLAMLPAKENLFPENWSQELKELPGLENIPMDFDSPFKRYAEFLPNMAARNEMLDLRPALKKAAKTQPVYYPRDSHFNPLGHEVSARAMTEWLGPTVLNSLRR